MSLEVKHSLEGIAEAKLAAIYRSESRRAPDMLRYLARIEEVLDWYFGARLRRDYQSLAEQMKEDEA